MSRWAEERVSARKPDSSEVVVQMRTYKISEVASAAGVSVRTLHYYDEIGLLKPSGRTEAGYRLYTDEDLLRLQQVLLQREFGMTLEEVRRWLDEPGRDRRAALISQRRKLVERQAGVVATIKAVDHALSILDEQHRQRSKDMTTDIHHLFEGFDPKKHEAEVKERWGDTDAYKESMHRTKSYGPSEWQTIKDEQTAIYADAQRLHEAGVAPDSEEAMDVAERHRLSIDRWFHPCPKDLHRRLPDLWESDNRFEQNIDKHGAGLTHYLAAAVRANADR